VSDLRKQTARRLRRARTRITATTVVCIAVVLVASAAIMLARYRSDLIHRTDERLRAVAKQVPAVAQGGIPLPANAAASTTDSYVQLVDGRDRVLFASRLLDGEGVLWAKGEAQGPHTVTSRSRGDLRIVAARFKNSWLVFAEPMQPVDETVQTVRNALLVVVPLSVLALGFVVWLAVRRALRPVAAAVQREEQLVADVSHELRSPIAGIRVLLETEPTDPEGVGVNRLEALATLSRLETITDQLLLLTRHDEPGRAVVARPVDLDEVVQRVVQRLAPRATCRIDSSLVVAGQVIGNERDLESLVDNLLSNAIRHARDVVRISVTEDGHTTVLAIDDDGPGIPTTERHKIFDRFTRLDEARARDDGGAGLGLAIVRVIVNAHHGTVVVDDAPGGGARFVVRLPASTRSDTEHAFAEAARATELNVEHAPSRRNPAAPT
jgi:signal transduction histidine kinase